MPNFDTGIEKNPTHKRNTMQSKLLFPLLCGIFTSGMALHTAHAKPCGNGHIADNKTCHVGNTSPATTPTASHNSHKKSPPATTYGQSVSPSNVSSGAYGRQESGNTAKHAGTLVQKAGLRTCPVIACQVVSNYPKGKKIFWTVENNGFVNLYDSTYWVRLSDVKKLY